MVKPNAGIVIFSLIGNAGTDHFDTNIASTMLNTKMSIGKRMYSNYEQDSGKNETKSTELTPKCKILIL